MAEDHNKQTGGSTDPPPKKDDPTPQERIDREIERRDAANGVKATQVRAAPAASGQPPSQQVKLEGPQAVSSASGRAPSHEAGQAQPPIPGESTLMEVIAQQRAKLQAKITGRPVEALSPPKTSAGQPAVGKDQAVAEATAGKEVSLQDIIAEQRERLKKKLGTQEPAIPSRAVEAVGDAAEEAVLEKAKATAKLRFRSTESPLPAGREAQARPSTAIVAAPVGRQWLTMAMLVANTFLLAGVGGLLLHMLSNRPPEPTAADEALKAVRLAQTTRPAEPSIPREAPPSVSPTTRQSYEPAASLVAAALAVPSWDAAASAYDKRDYDAAAERYSRLLLASRAIPSETLAGEFYQYRISQCMWQLGRNAEARQLLEHLTESDSPILRAGSRAALARTAHGDQQHLLARTMACQALADLKALDETMALEADCDYLIARAVTEKVRSYQGGDEPLPLSRLQLTDVFARRSEAEIRRSLASGSRGSQPAAGGIQIDKTRRGWTVSCAKMALEDLLHQFGTRTGKDVRWGKVAPAVRRRTVNLTLREVPEQRVFELACGVAGLAGRLAWDHVVVEDPQGMDSLVDQREALTAEGVSCWRRFSLRYPEDPRVAEGHYALGCLYEWAGDIVGAMKQYQLVGHQFQQELELAPRGLMQSARLRMGLRDYAGASTDLTDVLDLYPQYPRTDEVHLALGRVSMAAGRFDAAVRSLLKVQHLEGSPAIRRAACLEAGDCYLRMGNHAEASKCLTRYITTGQPGTSAELVRALRLLGRSEAAQGNRPAAAAALRQALACRPLRDDYVEIILVLAGVQVAGGEHIAALGTLRKIESEELNQEQRYRYLVAGSAAYRAMGVPERAKAFLRGQGGGLSDAAYRARLAVEQSRCLAEAGDLPGARQGLSETLGQLGGGREAWEAALELAELSMKLNDPDQAVAVARELVRGTCPEDVRRRALELLGRAHLHRRDYEQAASALAALGATAPAGPKDQKK